MGGGFGPAGNCRTNDPITEATLFVADHAANLATVVRPALVSGKLVISDRYRTAFAYQSVTLGRCDPGSGRMAAGDAQRMVNCPGQDDPPCDPSR